MDAEDDLNISVEKLKILDNETITRKGFTFNKKTKKISAIVVHTFEMLLT